jgi:hypothetical protein
MWPSVLLRAKLSDTGPRVKSEILKTRAHVSAVRSQNACGMAAQEKARHTQSIFKTVYVYVIIISYNSEACVTAEASMEESLRFIYAFV